MNYKNLFLITLIAALCTGAVIGIFVFLFGELGDIEAKLLITTAAIGGFSLAGLSCAADPNLKLAGVRMSQGGMMASVLGFLIAFVTIWEIIDPDYTWQLLLATIVIAITMAHLSLISLLKPKTGYIVTIRKLTIFFILLTALSILFFIVIEFDGVSFLYRLLGVFAILNVLGTISLPILNLVAANEKHEDS